MSAPSAARGKAMANGIFCRIVSFAVIKRVCGYIQNPHDMGFIAEMQCSAGICNVEGSPLEGILFSPFPCHTVALSCN